MSTPISRRDPLYRAACRVHRHLSAAAVSTIPAATADLRRPMEQLSARQDALARRWRMIGLAGSRGWHLAARRLREQLLADARAIESAAAELRRRQSADPADAGQLAPSIQSVLDDLRQVRQEFASVDLRLKDGVVAAQTRRVELEGLDLGPFSIELHLGRLSPGHLDSSCFECVALEPSPASCNEEVTHPHVQDGVLCAGDATVPIATALRQGRVADAFCLINAVLHKYNPHSAYVRVEDWDGVRCGDCDCLTASDDLYCCNGCHRDVCDDCHSSCDLCGCSLCLRCLERDDVSGNDCCGECRQTCDACGRTVAKDSFDEESGLCPGCLEQQEQEQEQEKQSEEDEDDQHEENDDDERTDPSDTTDSGPADAPAPAAEAGSA